MLRWVYDAAVDASRELNAQKIETHVFVLGHPDDQELSHYCQQELMQSKFPLFTDEDDLVTRYLKASEGFTHTIRLTADCWQLNPKLIIEIAQMLQKADYASNTIFRTFIEGLDIQGCSYKALKWFDKNQKVRREHLFVEFDENAHIRVAFEKDFKYLQLINPRNPAVIHASIDTEEDLNQAREIYDASQKARPDLEAASSQRFSSGTNGN